MREAKRKRKESGLIGVKKLVLNYKTYRIMENEKSKVVKNRAPKGNVENPGQKKLSYEQLEQVVASLNQQCGQMRQIINNQQQVIAEFNEIGMLLSVLSKSEHFNEKFVNRCSSKIEELITKAMDASEKQETEKEN